MVSSRRTAALAVLCLTALMIVLDSTIVAVALPAIQADLGFSDAALSWVVNGYLIGFGVVLLPAGRLGDLVGARSVLLAGLLIFTVASLGCGLAPAAGWLVAGRLVQGVGGGLASAVIFGLIVRLYPEARGQARALGVYSFTQAGGAALGFVAGGLVTEAAGWPWIFLVNVPIGAIALVAGVRVVPREAGAGVRTGQSVLRSRRLWAALAATVLIFGTGMGFQYVNALYLQRVLGLDPVTTGLAFLPTPIVIGVVSLVVAPRVTARFGLRTVLTAGLALMAGGLLLLFRMPADATYAIDVLPPLVVMGLGVGVVIPAIIMQVMRGVATADTGFVSGLANTAQQAGGAAGVAILALVAARVTESQGALRDGYSAAFLVAGAFVIGALVLTLLGRRPVASEEVNVTLTR
ncbi:MFS transporter [Actinoplanes sp. RD1]|uniref:MFS transporter n=1 Tax=Actinoplanes sp. RD1 TaxID=3064538 RepID=UPI0027406E9D|nr:MFS transporter [Actinoplanes sp. RD1]